MQIVRRLSPLAPWRLLRTLDEVPGTPGAPDAGQARAQGNAKTAEADPEVQQRLDAQAKQTRDEPKALAGLGSVEQSRAIYKSDTRFKRALERALQQIGDGRVPAHVRAVVAAAPLESDPCPYVVLDDLLPDDAYDALLSAIPPPLFFEHLNVTRQDSEGPLRVRPSLPLGDLARVPEAHLREGARTGADRQVPGRPRSPGAHTLARHRRLDGRRGHQPAPGGRARHASPIRLRDQAAPRSTLDVADLHPVSHKRDDRQLYGTQLCRLQRDQEFPTHSPFWVPEDDVEVVREVPAGPTVPSCFSTRRVLIAHRFQPMPHPRPTGISIRCNSARNAPSVTR